MGENKIEMPRAGPDNIEGAEGITCTTFMFGNRGPAQFVNIFRIDDSVSGLGIAYPAISEEESAILIKLGKASIDSVLITLDDDQLIRGFYGSATETEMTQLGVIIENTKCSQQEAQKKREAEKLATLTLAEQEDGGSGAVLIVVIVIIILVFAAAATFGVFWYLQQRKL